MKNLTFSENISEILNYRSIIGRFKSTLNQRTEHDQATSSFYERGGLLSALRLRKSKGRKEVTSLLKTVKDFTEKSSKDEDL